jgi:hypothetical protein
MWRSKKICQTFLPFADLRAGTVRRQGRGRRRNVMYERNGGRRSKRQNPRRRLNIGKSYRSAQGLLPPNSGQKPRVSWINQNQLRANSQGKSRKPRPPQNQGLGLEVGASILEPEAFSMLLKYQGRGIFRIQFLKTKSRLRLQMDLLAESSSRWPRTLLFRGKCRIRDHHTTTATVL